MPEEISTVGDTKRNRNILNCGFPQGSSLSPSLFNIYIEELTEKFSEVPRSISELLVNLFVEDVLVLEKDDQGLQVLLNI